MLNFALRTLAMMIMIRIYNYTYAKFAMTYTSNQISNIMEIKTARAIP